MRRMLRYKHLADGHQSRPSHHPFTVAVVELWSFAYCGYPESAQNFLPRTFHKTFRHRFQFFPARPDLYGFGRRNFFIGGAGGDDVEQVGEFLDDLVRRRNQKMRMRRIFGIEDKKSPRALANPLDEPMIAGALQQGFDAVERIDRAAARSFIGRFSPFVDHRGRQAEVSGDLFGRFIFKNFAQ